MLGCSKFKLYSRGHTRTDWAAIVQLQRAPMVLDRSWEKKVQDASIRHLVRAMSRRPPEMDERKIVLV
jgi:hypothetical protein